MTTRVITVQRDLQAAVHGRADEFRAQLAAQGTLVINVLSAPGSGKTSLLAASADCLHDKYRCAVLVGDIATDLDAQRLAPHMPVVQLTTGGACHLEYPLIEQGWRALGTPQVDFLFLENIGNLVCPASHDLGEHLRVLLLSTTEGDDKPAKYPKAFRTSHALVVSKSDLLPYVPFDVDRAIGDARSIRPEIACFTTSTQVPRGLKEWCEYLATQRQEMLAGKPCRPNR